MSQPRTHAIDPELGEQLSALMDGELDAERSRFLLRRVQGDPALRAAWERWQLVSGSLKGQLTLHVDAGFLARVRDGIEQGRHSGGGTGSVASEDVSGPATRRNAPGWLRWAAGGAIAASVAVVALMATQPQVGPPGDALVESVPAEPYTVAPSLLVEADLRPRLRAPAQAVSVQQRGPLLQAHGGIQAPDSRVPEYLILHDGRLEHDDLGTFMPYVEAAEGRQRAVAVEPATR